MNRKVFISILSMTFSLAAYSQNCEYTPSKNIQKILDNIRNNIDMTNNAPII